MTSDQSAGSLTLGEYMAFLGWGGERGPRPPEWPPDTFALVGAILRRGDAYRHAASPQWKPPVDWQKTIAAVARQWRVSASKDEAPPLEVGGWWAVVWAAQSTVLEEVHTKADLLDALLSLSAAADEASAGIGIPGPGTGGRADDEYDVLGAIQLFGAAGRTLCRDIHPSRVVVLPKLHTPQNGMTLRSLSHNLSLWDSGEVGAHWWWMPWEHERDFGLNILLLPTPAVLTPLAFTPRRNPLPTMPEKAFGFFSCGVAEAPEVVQEQSLAVWQRAKQLYGDIHMLVFPELALPRDAAEGLAAQTGACVVGGVGSAPDDASGLGTNAACVAYKLGRGDQVQLKLQPKHHRWRLDESQIRQYGLGGVLDCARGWWEAIDLSRRGLSFYAASRWLTFCVLICEDLARQDPVADLVRAVGPNLVIALLQDGPQLSQRWSARYATTLADDPGCSVLTLTSVGMATLCRPKGQPVSRVVALWKDPSSGAPEEIALAPDADGIVLNISRVQRTEYAADGRGDEGTSYGLTLSGVHQVRGSHTLTAGAPVANEQA